MNENEPHLILNAGDREVRADRFNTKLFTFAGELATRNHIFITYSIEENISQGAYIFNHSDVYAQIMGFVTHHNFPMSLNANEVSEGDEDAFQRSLDQITGTMEEDYIPEGWGE